MTEARVNFLDKFLQRVGIQRIFQQGKEVIYVLFWKGANEVVKGNGFSFAPAGYLLGTSSSMFHVVGPTDQTGIYMSHSVSKIERKNDF